MGINIIKGEIKIIIETLGEQYEVINQRSGRIPQIELDIVMSNIRKLYERLCDLNKLNSPDSKTITEEVLEIVPEKETETVEKTVVQPEIEKKETVIEEKKIEILFAEKEIIPETIKEEKEDTIEITPPEVNLEKTKEIIFDLKDVQKEENKTAEVTDEKIEPPAVEVKPTKTGKKDNADLFSLTEKETLADKFKETQKSMHDKIANEKPDKTLADKIGKSSIVNLKNAIGINDKFLFINELFKGDIQEYNKTIDKLNSYTMLEECTNFLDELKEKFHWGEKPDAYQKLEDLLIRKFL
jgi:hypothetical protein